MFTKQNLILSLFFFLLGAGLAIQFRGDKVIDPGVPSIRVDELPDRIVPTEGVVEGVRERIVYREHDPEVTYEAPNTAPDNGNYREVVTEKGDTVQAAISAVEQLSYNGGNTVSVFLRGDSTSTRRDFQIPRHSSFDFYFKDGQPILRTPRCIVCAAELQLEGGVRINEETQAPYAAIDGSVALLDRNLRLFIRPEINIQHAEVKAGFRYRF